VATPQKVPHAVIDVNDRPPDKPSTASVTEVVRPSPQDPVVFNAGGPAGGRSSTSKWMAKRSLPIWQMVVEVPISCGGFGNGSTLFLRLFMRTLMPPIPAKRQAAESGFATLQQSLTEMLRRSPFMMPSPP
jgi:hypothetical protein